MKNRYKGKLNLDKIKIARLNNTRAIIGGSLPTLELLPTDDQPRPTIPLSDTVPTSTKTLPVGGSIIHPTDI